MNLELQFTLHEAPEPFFTVKALILPKDPTDEIRYTLVDKKADEGPQDAERFKALLNRVRFPKGPKFQFYVHKGGKRRLATIPLPAWPVSLGYMIRMMRVMGELKLG